MRTFALYLFMLMQVYVTVALFFDDCPNKLMWNLRGKTLCGAKDKYMCLYDTNERKFRELCKDEPEFHRPGNVFVISGNLRYFAGRSCYANRYQPHKWWTNGSSECQYLKSTCSEEGQVPYDNGTITRDRACRCDYTNYFAFVNITRNKCYCDPIKEDCACYKKRCNEDEVLTPDYDCVNIHEWTGRFVCPEYKPPRTNNNIEMPTLCPIIEKDFSGTIKHPLARITNTVIIGFIVVVGVMSIVFVKIRKSSQDDIQKIKKDMKFNEEKHEKMVKEINQIKDNLPETKQKDEDRIPKNIRAKHEQEIHEWEQDQKSFVQTRATLFLLSSLSSNGCIVITGEPGCGKSSNIQHVALHLRDDFGYEIIPVFLGPSDIMNYNNKLKNQVFVVDDICGKEASNKQVLKVWRDYSENLDKLFTSEESDVKKETKMDESRGKMFKRLLITCRLNTYKDSEFQLIELLTRKGCNLSSYDMSLLPEERLLIMKKYIAGDITQIMKQVKKSFENFPLLCKLSNYKTPQEVRELFDDPIKSLGNNITQIIKENKEQCFALVLCVVFEDGFNTDWIKSAPEKKKYIFENVARELKIEKSHINTLKESGFVSLEGMYLKRRGTEYRVIHDIIYKMTAVICGKYHTKCLIKYTPSTFVRDHFVLKIINNQMAADDLIVVPPNMEDVFFERLLKDLEDFVVASTFQNKQLEYKSFVEKLIFSFKRNDATIQLLRKLDTEGCKLKRDDENIGVSFKTTPLIEAAAGGYNYIATYLIDTVQCNVNNKDGRGRSSLYRASEEGFVTLVELLIKNDADVHQCDHKRNFPLHMACERGHTEIVKLLLKKSMHISQCNIYGESPLHLACKEGHADIVTLLLDSKANFFRCNSHGMSPLNMACIGGHLSVAKQLLQHNESVYYNDQKKTMLLHMACAGGHTDIVKLLLEKNPDVSQLNSYGNTALHLACEGGFTNIVELLLGQNCDIYRCNHMGKSSLYVACRAGQTEIAKQLFRKKCDVYQRDQNRKDLFYIACKGGHADIVELLLNKNADITQLDPSGNSPLHVACRLGFTDIVKLLLQQNGDITRCNNNGKSPLYMACLEGHTVIVGQLLEKNCYVYQKDRNKNIILHIACERGHTDIMKLLLQTNADIFHCDSNGNSLLHVACREGFNDIVKLLLLQNAVISICNRPGQTPLYLACLKGHTAIVKQLLLTNDRVYQRDQNKDILLHIACQGGHTDIVKLLLQHNADGSKLDKFGNSPLHVACERGFKDLVELLLQRNVEISQCNNNGISPFFVACKKGHEEIAEQLLRQNSSIYQTDHNRKIILHMACEAGHTQIVQMLLQNNYEESKGTSKRNSVLHMSCGRGHTNTIELLLQKNADVLACYSNGDSLLHAACEAGHTAIVELLLENKADLHQCNNNGDSPLHVACGTKHTRIVQLLLEKKADPLQCNNIGDSPLHVAAERGYTDTVEMLLKNKANVSLCNSYGDSPLHVACEGCHISTVKMLLQHKADVSLRNSYGDSPLHVACEEGHSGIVEILLKHNADVNVCNCDGDSPLNVACDRGYEDISKLLAKSYTDLL